MEKDIELLKELKGRLTDKMVIDSRRTFVNPNAINKCGEYIGALSNAIQMMEGGGVMRKLRVYNFEDREMWIADDYEDLSNLFMALNADDSMYSPLMQSTGLLDSSTPKKEIFEGDIVELECELTGHRSRYIITFYSEICFWDKDTEFSFWGMREIRFNNLKPISYLDSERVNVLGNIYQTPELLEVVE